MYLQGDMERGEVFLTSGFQPPAAEGDLVDQLDVSCHFQAYATGGAVLHLFLGEELSGEQKVRLIRSIVENFPVYYFTLTPVLVVCNECGEKRVGKWDRCAKCGSDDVTVWSRPVGYFRPVMRKRVRKDFRGAEYTFWLDARIEDFARRKVWMQEDIERFIDEVEEVWRSGE